MCDFEKDCSYGEDEESCGTCSFEEGTCGFTNSDADTFDWKRNSLGDEAFYSTMPADHTVPAADVSVLSFPSPPTSKNYALLKTSLPALTEFTMCLWASSNDKDSKGYMFSLATGSGNAANEIALSALSNLNTAVKSVFQQTQVLL